MLIGDPVKPPLPRGHGVAAEVIAVLLHHTWAIKHTWYAVEED